MTARLPRGQLRECRLHHAITGENVYMKKQRNGTRHPVCLKCIRERQRAYRADPSGHAQMIRWRRASRERCALRAGATFHRQVLRVIRITTARGVSDSAGAGDLALAAHAITVAPDQVAA